MERISYLPGMTLHLMEGSIRKFFLLWDTNLPLCRWIFSASKPPWCLTTSSEWDTKCKSFNLTVSFLAFITFTGPVKWFRFQNLNPWPSLNLPNIFCQVVSWTFEGKVNQMGVCFPSVKAEASWSIFVCGSWRAAKNEQRCLSLVKTRDRSWWMVTNAGEGSFMNRIQNLGVL